jgi:hypothetical protein
MITAPQGALLDLTPAFILSVWSGGLALCVALVTWWKVTGPGFVWLGGAASLMAGVPAIVSESEAAATTGVVLIAAGTLLARRPGAAAALLAGGGVAMVVAAITEGGVASAVSGALFLGGVTGEMMFGHWYLVDPTLPRLALRRLALVGLGGAVADVVIVAVLGAFPWASGDLVVGLGYLALAATSALLMVGVWFSLGEPGYSGVMAATGLSYLAVLTALGAAVLGRLLAEGRVLG